MTAPMRNSVVLIALGLVAPLGLTGCGKKQPTTVTKDALVGTWIEVRAPGGELSTGRGSEATRFAGKTPNLRKITINADGTFRMVLVTPDGKPVDQQVVEGTCDWSKKYEVVFDVTTNTLPEAINFGAPMSSWGLQKQTIPGKGDVDAFVFTDVGAFQVVCVPAQ